ncbi:MAG: PKD domain-containing protein [Bacteroidetes bacterium]|nr:PKD domain-containing protein [Bacteroidota bacterium]
MKHIITLFCTVVLTLSGLQAQVILAENFDSGLGGWTESGGGGLGWFSGTDLDFFGASSSIDGTNMAFIDDDANGSGSAAFTSILTSPVVDVSSFTVVRLEFDYNFLSACGSEFFAVEVFDGSSWVQVYFVNTEDCGFWGCDAATGAYPHADLDLTPYINPAFQIRLIYDDGFGCWGWWIAVDNVVLFQPPPVDMNVSEIVAPLSGCSLGAAEILNVTVSNTGTLPQSGFDLFFSVDGVVSGPETFPGTVNPGESLPYAFAAPADLSGAGIHEISAWTAAAGDGFPTNDTSTVLVESFPSIAAPYLETFDGSGFSTPAGWFNDPFDGGFEDWFFTTGAPGPFGTGPTEDHTTGSGFFAYVSDWGEQESIEMSSPCINVAPLFAPYVSFWYHSREATDGSIPDFVNELHVDIQSGGTWFEDVIPPIGTEIDAWQEIEIDLAPYGSDIRVRFRAGTDNGWFEHFIAIDDFRVFDKPPVDVSVADVLSPLSECGLGNAETVEAVVENTGSLPQSGFNVNYRVDGGSVVTQAFPGVITPGAEVNFVFTTTADFSTPGTRVLEVWTDLVGDLAPYNDTLVVSIDNVPTVNVFPYVQNFESGPDGWAAINVANSTWALGTPASFVINTPPPSTPASLNSWMTNLTGTYNNNEEGWVLSPCFDFSSLLAPEILLDIWWDAEGFWDGTNIQYSTDNGLSWNAVGSFFTATGENWYNNDFLVGLDYAFFQEGWSNSGGVGSGGWLRAKEDLTGLGGAPSVRFRVNFGSDGSVTQEGIAFDNFIIRDKPAADLAVIALVDPVDGCELSSSETVTVTIENEGTAPQSGFPVRYRVNGGSVVSETFTGTIPALSVANFTFATPANLSAIGPYSIETWTALSGDESTFNDSITTVVTNVPVVTAFPYSEDFETPSHGWTTGGTASSWELGLPVGPVIIAGTETGSNSWVTNLDGAYNNNERSFIISPCFDFSSMSNPAVALDIWWEVESGFFFGPTDGAIMQYTLDGGASWARVGNFGEPINWYNYSSIGSSPGDEPFPAPGWSGNLGSGDGSFTWVRAQHNLDGLAGLSDVRLRIAFASDGFGTFDGIGVDNFGIQDAPAPDLGGDTAFCFGGSVVLSPGIVGSTYQWSTGAGTPTITVSTGGTFWCKVTDANGFSGTDTIVVEVIDFPTVDLGIDRDFCEGALLDAENTGLAFLWSTGATTQTIDVTSSGTYSVTVSVPGYGCPTTDEVSLNIINGPTANFLWTASGNTAFFFDASPASTAWSWNFGDGATSDERDPSHEFAGPGTYEVTLIAENECGTSEITLQITIVVSGLDASQLGQNLVLFPNPTSDWVQISGSVAPSEELIWVLYDVSGRQVSAGTEFIAQGGWNFAIDVSAQAEGAYLLELRSADQSVMARVFKQ